MKGALFLLTLAPALLSAASKPDFAPIPAEVWTMKDAAGKGAVILSERFHVENSEVHRVYRIRIFNEAGKAAAELANLPDDVFELKGRTVYPDGKTVAIDSKKDLQTKTVVATSSGELNKKVLIPPGLSTDCVVDLQWKEKRYYKEMAENRVGRMESMHWNESFPIHKLEIEISKRLAWQWSLFPGIFSGKQEVVEKGDWKTLVYTDIPASETVPFTLAPSRSMLRFDLFPPNENLRFSYDKAPEAFWQDVVEKEYKPMFENRLSRGGAYRDFSEKLRKDLKGSPLQIAGELLTRLDAALKNTSQMTFAEKSALKGGKLDWEIDSWDLNQAAKHQATDGLGMFFMGYGLLKDQGLQLKLALVADRDQRYLEPTYKNPNQVTNWLLGVVGSDNKTLWFDPAMRFAMPGLIHPDFQGTKALIVNCKDWKSQFEPIGVQAAALNQSRFTYQLNVGEDQDAIKLVASFGGAPEYAERSLYMKLEPKEQAKTLKESLEQITKSVTITKSEVSNAADPRNNLAWQVEGINEREPGRRMEIYPFPLMRWPVSVPTQWPETRTMSIVLPYPSIQLAVSQIKLPKGFSSTAFKIPSHKNEMGSVTWAMEVKPSPDGDDVKVVLRVDLNVNVAPASFYPQLKEFVHWVEEACQRTIVVEKS